LPPLHAETGVVTIDVIAAMAAIKARAVTAKISSLDMGCSFSKCRYTR
jgi:hypothetical protein